MVVMSTCMSQNDIGDTKCKPLREKFCLGCGSSTHLAPKCQIFYLKLKQANVKKHKEEAKNDHRQKNKAKKRKDKCFGKKIKNQKNETRDESCLKAIVQLVSIIAALKTKDSFTNEKKDTSLIQKVWNESFII